MSNISDMTHTNACINEKGILQERSGSYTACHALILPDIPFDDHESIILTSWVCVLHGYYNMARTGWGKVLNTKDGTRTVSYTSFNPDTSKSICETRSTILNLDDSLLCVEIRDIRDEFLMVFLPSVECDPVDEGSNIISQLVDLVKVRKYRIIVTT